LTHHCDPPLPEERDRFFMHFSWTTSRENTKATLLKVAHPCHWFPGQSSWPYPSKMQIFKPVPALVDVHYHASLASVSRHDVSIHCFNPECAHTDNKTRAIFSCASHETPVTLSSCTTNLSPKVPSSRTGPEPCSHRRQIKSFQPTARS
jgi:hypothetical protein